MTLAADNSKFWSFMYTAAAASFTEIKLFK